MSLHSDHAAWQYATFQRNLAVFGHEAARRFVAAGVPPEGVLAEEPPPRPARPRRRLFRRTPPPPPWPDPVFAGWGVFAADPHTGELRTGGHSVVRSARTAERVTSSTGLFVTTQGECRLVNSCARGEALPGDDDELERYHLSTPEPVTAERLAALYGFGPGAYDAILDYLAAGVEMTTRGQDRFA